MAYRRLSRAKPRKRRRNGYFVKTRRPSSRTKAVVKKRRGVRKVSTMSARAFFDASRWHHKPDLRVPDQVSEYTPVRGVSRVNVNGPTEPGGSAIYVFAWTPSVARCLWLTHIQNATLTDFYDVAFPFVASHSQAAGPSLCRPLRQSVAIRNISASEKGGRCNFVYYARIILSIGHLGTQWVILPPMCYYQRKNTQTS